MKAAAARCECPDAGALGNRRPARTIADAAVRMTLGREAVSLAPQPKSIR